LNIFQQLTYICVEQEQEQGYFRMTLLFGCFELIS
jgi:hypothetical protein